MVEDRNDQDYGGVGFIIAWTILIMLGMAVEFLGRFFGYVNNPLSIYYPLISAFTGIAAAFIILAGYFILIGTRAKQKAMVRRKGVLLIALGASMLVSFFVFKQVMPLIFG
jgi:prepilin signal peptidase PulO-like enzyme (type II secretory pathway)